MPKHTILHTSDWHLGQQLHGKKRDDEFAAFLDWLVNAISTHGVDTLLVAGDVFDNGTPGTWAQKLYYNFLFRAVEAGARHVVVTAGNHDSPSFLAAPAELLRQMRVHVIGSCTENPADEIMVLKDENGEPELVVCAVPFLRERDVRESSPGESLEDKEHNLAAGIRNHYHLLAQTCADLRIPQNVPVIAMGHLYTAGATPGDGVRDLYIGNLGQVSHEIFPSLFSYVALGHLHRPQKVGACSHIRYSGSPLPMSFAEAGQRKETVLVTFKDGELEIDSIAVPHFRNLMTVSGSCSEILNRLGTLAAQKADDEIWLEIIHNGQDSPGTLNNDASDIIKDTCIKILRIKTGSSLTSAVASRENTRMEEISPEEMFLRLLKRKNVMDENEMLDAFRELMAIRHEQQREDG